MAMDLAVVDYGSYKTRPSALLNSVFMTTVNAAAKTLVAVVSNAKAADSQSDKWKPGDHLRFMLMLMTWLAVWVLRVLMDHCPFSMGSSYSLDDSGIGSFDLMLPSSSSSSLVSSSSGGCSLDLVLREDSDYAPPTKSLGRALTLVKPEHECC